MPCLTAIRVSAHYLHFFMDGGCGAWEFGAVPRNLRMEYRRTIYQVMNREDRREDLFGDNQDRPCFLATLGLACEKNAGRRTPVA